MFRLVKVNKTKTFKLTTITSVFVLAQLAVPLAIDSGMALAHHKPGRSQGYLHSQSKEHSNNGKAYGRLNHEVESQTKSSDEDNFNPSQSAAHQTGAVKHSQMRTRTQVRTQISRSSHDPLGNNGTVKIDRLTFDNHPNNQPHVGCTFQVDFYGFDEGVGNATVNFEEHSPTADANLTVISGDLTPNIGEDDASGGTDLDASETYKLDFSGQPHPQQGYHVKLTVDAPGSQGNDTKHKVFWVEGCEENQPAENDEGQTLGTSTKNDSAKGGGVVLPAQTESTPQKLVNTGASSLLGTVLAAALIGTAAGISFWKREQKQTRISEIAL